MAFDSPTIARSDRREVRNPVFALAAARALLALPAEQKVLLAAVLYDLATDARRRADDAWEKNKGPMAVYWKAVGAYSRHIARALRSEVANG